MCSTRPGRSTHAPTPLSLAVVPGLARIIFPPRCTSVTGGRATRVRIGLALLLPDSDKTCSTGPHSHPYPQPHPHPPRWRGGGGGGSMYPSRDQRFVLSLASSQELLDQATECLALARASPARCISPPPPAHPRAAAFSRSGPSATCCKGYEMAGRTFDFGLSRWVLI